MTYRNSIGKNPRFFQIFEKLGLRGFERRSRAALVIKLEGRPLPCSPPASHSLRALFEALPRLSPAPRLCRPTSAGRSPAPIQPAKPRWRAGKVGADGASPSRSRATAVCELAKLAQSRGDDLRVPLPRSVRNFSCCFTANLYKGMPCAPLIFYPCFLPWLQAHWPRLTRAVGYQTWAAEQITRRSARR